MGMYKKTLGLGGVSPCRPLNSIQGVALASWLVSSWHRKGSV